MSTFNDHAEKTEIERSQLDIVSKPKAATCFLSYINDIRKLDSLKDITPRPSWHAIKDDAGFSTS
ncbi:hypothetical protein CVT25_004787 [Psilocybe cyanescens]|uniref:Uncharacterized protein n=1 Tax=Psilocybe cyanescens TaxID=93625 RepID=A0A409XGJ4_PSICY|nr:hypothetical protein CVT25_004787 [Psilocybe cyanescens]